MVAAAADVLVPLRAGLVPVPATPQETVCQFCHGAGDPVFPQCYPCFEAHSSIGAAKVLPISLSIEGGLLHQHLSGYKNLRDEAARRRMSRRLAALLAVWLPHHMHCLGEYDAVVTVPSTRRDAVKAIIDHLPALREQWRPILRATGVGKKSDLRADRFEVTASVRGRRLLVLDDTLTRGPSLYSAVAALRQEGGLIVGPVVLGRHVRRSWTPSQHLLSWLQERTWEEDRCGRCAGEQIKPSRLF